MNNSLQLLSLALISASTLSASTLSASTLSASTLNSDTRNTKTDYSAPYENFNDGLNITLTPAWQHIGHGKALGNTFGGTWICAGIITIKKRINEALSLTEAAFHWNGSHITSLHASLYRKNGEPFLAIEENLVSDGVWKSNQQLLSFSFNNKQVLDPITTFYLVLTVPSPLEQHLKKGSFQLLASHLPAQIQPYLENKTLSLALKDLGPHKSTKLAQVKR